MKNEITLFDYLNSIIPLGKEETEQIRSAFSIDKVEKGKLLVEEGKTGDHIYFINKGYFRIFVTQDVDQVTTHLAGPGEFISSFSSFLTRSASLEHVQSITEAEVYLLHYDRLQELYNNSPRFERLGRLIIEKYFIEKDNQVVSFIRDSAEDRYRKLLTEHPDFLLHIPLQYIASFLGVKPETLSRIRAKTFS